MILLYAVVKYKHVWLTMMCLPSREYVAISMVTHVGNISGACMHTTEGGWSKDGLEQRGPANVHVSDTQMVLVTALGRHLYSP